MPLAPGESARLNFQFELNGITNRLAAAQQAVVASAAEARRIQNVLDGIYADQSSSAVYRQARRVKQPLLGWVNRGLAGYRLDIAQPRRVS